MTEPAGHQPETAYCTFESERGGTTYRCIREVHKGGAHTLKPNDDLPDALRTYFAKTTRTDLEDTAADLVPTDTTSATDATVAKIVQRLAGLAEQKRFADLLAYEVDTGIALSEELAGAEELWADRRHADHQAILRIKLRVDAWLLQRGIREDGGGS